VARLDVRLSIRLLGEPLFRFDGAPWRYVAPPRTFPLLAIIALHRGPISRSQLASTLWPDELPEDARSNLRRHLHRLVKALPEIDIPWLLTDTFSVAWNHEAPAVVDALEFEALAAHPETAPDAIERYTGELLPDCYDEPIVAARERLKARYLQICYDGAVEARRERRFAAAAAFAERIMAIDPLREDALRLLMAVRYDAGDRSTALSLYERFVALLRAEMGIAPMPETAALRDTIVANEPLATQSADSADLELSRGNDPLPFVGRADDLSELRAAWRRAAAGNGTLVFVSGEPGIGKSRLVAELALAVDAEGGRVLSGITSKPETQPYQALVDALRRSLQLLSETDVEFVWLSALAALIPELSVMVPGLPQAPNLEAAAARTRLFEAIARCFEALSRARPVLLILEDLHWASPAGIQALEVLARRAGVLPILIVATYRPEEVEAGSALRDLRKSLQRDRRAVTISLRPLDRSDVERIVTLTPSLERAPEELAASLFVYSEGNPLFVAQLLRDFVESGALPEATSAVVSLKSVILSRVERLDPGVRAVLEVAAIIGSEFSIEIVAAVGGWQDFEVLDAIAVLAERSLVRETHRGRFDYAFSHALIWGAVYESSDPVMRRERHGRIATFMSRMTEYAESAAVGLHWERSGALDRASVAYARSARAALGVYARDAAERYAADALRLAQDDEAVFEACMTASEALARYGDVERWRGYLDRAQGVASQMKPQRRFALLESREQLARQLGETAVHERTVAEMCAIGDALGDDTFRALALEARGRMLILQGRLGEAIVAFREGLGFGEVGGDAAVCGRLRTDLVHGLARVGDVDAARAELAQQRAALADDMEPGRLLNLLLAEATMAAVADDVTEFGRVGEELLEVAKNVGNVSAQAVAHSLLGHAGHLRHDVASMREHHGRAVALLEMLDARRTLSGVLVNWGSFERVDGNLHGALALMDRASSFTEASGKDIVCSLAINRADVYLALGDTQRGYEVACQGLALARDLGETRILADALIVAGAAMTVHGEVEEGIARLDEALQVLRTGHVDGMICEPLCWIVEALLDAGRIDAANERAEELERVYLGGPVGRYPTRVCWVLARAAASRGDAAARVVWMERGGAILRAHLGKLSNDDDRAAYRAMAFNRSLESAPA
jgi:DNA-binding SARP family transcriptional activator